MSSGYSASATTTTTTTNRRLSQEQIAFYRREGYLTYEQPVLPPVKFDALRRHFDDKLARLPAHVRPEAMDVPHFTDTKLFDWLLADEVLDLVEPIIGPDIALFSSHFICKPGGTGKKVPWHEDSYYWRTMMSPIEVCTVWLAIDPSTRANGCMKVIPRTFHGFSDYEPVDIDTNVFATEIKRSCRDDSKVVYIELQPNQASLHDGRLMHASDPNISDLRRCGYTMRYMSTRIQLNEDARKFHQIYLARGRDLGGNDYADHTKSYNHLARYREESGRKGH